MLKLHAVVGVRIRAVQGIVAALGEGAVNEVR
jgi:hypothetical protein